MRRSSVARFSIALRKLEPMACRLARRVALASILLVGNGLGVGCALADRTTTTARSRPARFEKRRSMMGDPASEEWVGDRSEYRVCSTEYGVQSAGRARHLKGG